MGSSAAGAAGSVIGGMADVAAGNASRETAYGLKDNAMRLAAPSAGEIATMDKMNQAASYNLQRQQAILSSVDPAVMEMGKQTLAMLRGEKETGTNSLMRNQIAQNRQALQDKLQKQLGSGWATSTAGIQAMNQFDTQTADALQANQQNTIGQYMGFMSPFAQQGVQQSFGMYQNLGTMQDNIQKRQIGALEGFSSNIMNTEGTQYGGQKLLGQTISANAVPIGGSLGGLAGLFGGGSPEVNSSSGGVGIKPKFSANPGA